MIWRGLSAQKTQRKLTELSGEVVLDVGHGVCGVEDAGRLGPDVLRVGHSVTQVVHVLLQHRPARQWGGLANTFGPLLTRPNCQIGDTETIWSVVIGSQCKFRASLAI